MHPGGKPYLDPHKSAAYVRHSVPTNLVREQVCKHATINIGEISLMFSVFQDIILKARRKRLAERQGKKPLIVLHHSV
jgi:hypothetical protein